MSSPADQLHIAKLERLIEETKRAELRYKLARERLQNAIDELEARAILERPAPLPYCKFPDS